MSIRFPDEEESIFEGEDVESEQNVFNDIMDEGMEEFMYEPELSLTGRNNGVMNNRQIFSNEQNVRGLNFMRHLLTLRHPDLVKSFDKRLNIEESPANFVRVLTMMVGDGVKMVSWEPSSADIILKNKIMIQFGGNNSGDSRNLRVMSEKVERKQYYVKVMGFEKDINRFLSKLDAHYENKELLEVRWWYQTGGGHFHFDSIIIDRPEPIHTCMYPWFNKDGGPDQFFENYLNSKSSLLFIMGPKGTGKTTFLRYMIHKHWLKANIGYSPQLLENDQFFIEFMTGDSDIMIIEDADTVLQAREDTKNHLISRFLNVADGIISVPHKKMVFTTNLSSFNKIDEALTRPGRCYAFTQFRDYSHHEAVDVARALGIADPQEERNYSLAELTNGKNGFVGQKFGF